MTVTKASQRASQSRFTGVHENFHRASSSLRAPPWRQDPSPVTSSVRSWRRLLTDVGVLVAGDWGERRSDVVASKPLGDLDLALARLATGI